MFEILAAVGLFIMGYAIGWVRSTVSGHETLVAMLQALELAQAMGPKQLDQALKRFSAAAEVKS